MKRLQIIRARLAPWWSNVVVRVAVGAIVSVVFLALALRAVPVDQVWDLLAQANLMFVGLTLASIVVNTIAKALRWKVLLGADWRSISVWDMLGALLVGQMLNTFIPTRIGDLSRAYAIGQRGPGMAFVLGTVVVEKLLDMIAFGLIILGLLVFVPLPEWAAGPAYRVLVVGALVVAGMLAFSRGRRVAQLFAWTQRRFRRPFATKVFAAFHAAFQSGSVLVQPAAATKLVVLSALVWGTAILNNYLVFLALQINLPVGAAILLLVGLQVGISLPSLPGTIGVFEYVCVVVLGLFAVERGPALSYGILLHALVMIPPTIAALLFLLLTRASWRPPSAPHVGDRSSVSR